MRFWRRLSYRQARNTVVIVLVFGLLFSLGQMVRDILQERARVDGTVRRTIGLVIESATQAAYQLDAGLANRVVAGLLADPSVRSVTITDDFGIVLAHEERPAASGRYTWLTDRIVGRDIFYWFPLVSHTSQRQVGRLDIAIDSHVAVAHSINRVMVAVWNNLLMIAVLAVLLTLFFYFSITKPLLVMVRKLSGVDPSQPSRNLLPPPAGGHQEDELGLLTDAVNHLLVDFEDSLQRRRETEAQLQEREAQYRGIFNAASDGILIMNRKGDIVEANPQVHVMHGYAPGALIGQPGNRLLAPEHASEVSEFMKESSTGRRYDVQTLAMTADGRRFYVEIGGTRIVSEGETNFLAIIRDITERKRIEAERLAAEAKYRLVVENANDVIFVSQDGLIRFANRRAEEMTGLSQDQLIATPLELLIHEDDRAEVLARHRRCLTTDFAPRHVAFRIRNSAGAVLWVEINVVRMEWNGRPASLNFLRDISEQKQMEAQLLRAGKMEAVGALAGGIAHDFNNLLMGVQGHASLMMMDLDAEHPFYDRLKIIEQHVQSGAALTRQLLGVARGGKYEVKPVDPNDIVIKTSDMFGRTKKEIIIHRRCADDVWPVEADRTQIEQVLINLFLNAAQAMPDGGDLVIETRNVALEPDFAGSDGLTPGSYVMISVTDTGVGMDEATRQRVFDPFFTTKEMGRGTGLGLTSAYGIAKNHGGSISVYSEKGRGSTFQVYLPATERPAEREQPQPATITSGVGSVLLVDDEEMILEVGREMLAGMGYRVLSARSGTEAADLFATHRDQVDLVILDMIMPGMSGDETFDLLKEIKPEVKVLLASGYSLEGQARSILNKGCDGFIQKPFNMTRLSEKLTEIIGTA